VLRQETAKNIIRRYLAKLPVKVEQAILFGSTASDTRLADSDIDLIVISRLQRHAPATAFPHSPSWTEKIDLEAFGFTSEEYNNLRFKSIVVSEADEKGIRLITPSLQPGEPVG
jgi:predicted nucleotidyltransferase